MNENLRRIPSVSDILKKLNHLNKFDDKYLSFLIKKEISKIRKKAIEANLDLDKHQIISEVVSKVNNSINCSSKYTINGTGVVLHTGLGRAPIGRKILDNVLNQLSTYSNLELDLNNGKRGNRQTHTEKLISYVTGSDSALVVNNNAASVHLAVNEFAQGKEVIISRGQLVEIGGSFRIPEMIEKSGAKLVEVGTTNRTHLYDYENAINENTGLLLWVHTSNYIIKGFTSSPDISDIVSLGKKFNLPTMVDLGCGETIDLSDKGLKTNFVVSKIVHKRPNIITFSGDKLLGGPQSGIIVGDVETINRMKKNSLARVVRPDKFTIILLEQILRTYLVKDLFKENLTLFLLTRNRSNIKKIAENIFSQIDSNIKKLLSIEIVDTMVETGSGTLPEEKIESVALRFNTNKIRPDSLSRAFRNSSIAIVGYISNDKYYIDLKAVLPSQENELIIAINNFNFP